MASGYDSSYDGRFTQEFKEVLARTVHLSKGDKVLDVACGNGTLLAMLASKEDIAGFGVDISDQMIAEARHRYPEMEFFTASCEELPFGSESIDVIMVSSSYHHFPDVDAFAVEAKRVLKSGGQVYIAEVYAQTILRLLANLFMPLLRSGDVKLYSPSEISATFEEAGFRQIDSSVKGKIQLSSFAKPQPLVSPANLKR